jgi:hypothetical protein
MSTMTLHEKKVIRYEEFPTDETVTSSGKSKTAFQDEESLSSSKPIYISDLYRRATADEIVQDLLHGIDGIVRASDPRKRVIYQALSDSLNQRLGQVQTSTYSELTAFTQNTDIEDALFLEKTEPPDITNAFIGLMAVPSEQGESHYSFYDNDEEIDRF